MFALILLNIFTSQAANNAFDIGLSKNVVAVYRNKLLNYLDNDIVNRPLGKDQPFKFFEGAFQINFNLLEPQVQSISYNTTTTGFTLTPPNIILVNLTRINSVIVFNWNYKTAIGADYGTGKIYISNADFKSKVELVALPAGTLNLSVSDISLTLNDYNLELFGHRDTTQIRNVLNLFKKEIEYEIVSLAVSFIVNNVTKPTNENLSQSSMTAGISESIGFYYGLAANPIVSANSIQFNAKGVFVNPSSPNYSPSITGQNSVPDFKASSYNVQIYASDYTLNTLTNVFYLEGYFQGVINSSNTRLPLTTSTLNYIIPGIEETFTPNQPCKIVCNAQSYPSNVITAPDLLNKYGLIFTTFPAQCTVSVTSVNQVAIVLNISVQANSSLTIDDWYLAGNITILKVTSLTVAKTYITGGTVNTEGMMDFLNLVANLTIPFFNERFLNGGLKLPALPGIDLSNSELILNDHYLSIISNPIFTN